MNKMLLFMFRTNFRYSFFTDFKLEKSHIKKYICAFQKKIQPKNVNFNDIIPGLPKSRDMARNVSKSIM